MKNHSYKIYTLGCKVNQYDSSTLSGKLKAAGFTPITQDADIVIINTCAVTRTAITKDKQTANKARKENPRAKFVICGCWPRVYEDEADSFGVDLIWNNKDYDKLIDKIIKLSDKIAARPVCVTAAEPVSEAWEKARRFVKVQDGCRQFCAYCVIPYARGELSSRQPTEVINEIRKITESGVKEIILCGIHLGLYGSDLNDGKNNIDLAGLIAEILKIEKLERLRLSSIEINEVNDRILDLMKNNKKFCNHLHIPLQGGSDKILKAMNRPYSQKKFFIKMDKIKEIIPDIALNTDIIVGFPGETETDFKETIAMAEKISFSRVHVFPFSAHEKTPAATMPNQVSKETIIERANRLRDVGGMLKNRFRQKYAGQEMEVLVENKTVSIFHGKTEYYFDVDFMENDIIGKYEKNNIIGNIVRVKIL